MPLGNLTGIRRRACTDSVTRTAYRELDLLIASSNTDHTCGAPNSRIQMLRTFTGFPWFCSLIGPFVTFGL